MKKRKKISREEEKFLMEKLFGKGDEQDKRKLFLSVETTIRISKNKDNQNLSKN
jgi:hypothetical protein